MSWLRLLEEKMQEDELATTLGDASTIMNHPAQHKKQSVTGLIKEMWPAYLIEIIVIILGISITLALEEWRDHAKEKHLEQIYLRNLQTDVETDLKSLGLTIRGTHILLQKGEALLNIARSPATKTISPEQVYEDVRAILGRPDFITSDATFTDLKSSGNLHLIEDIQLKNLLFAYYNETQLIKELQDAERQTTISLSGVFFLKQIPLDDHRNQIVSASDKAMTALISDIEFNNNVLLRVTNRNELLGVYKKTDSLANLLHSAFARKTSD
jgi:hypothetical protein